MKPLWQARDKRRWLRRAANRAALRLGDGLKLPISPGLPRILMIEPTNHCNLRCPLCPTGAGTLRRPQGFMSLDLYRQVLADLDGALERLMLYNYGEPFLHPQIFEMISLARRSEIHTRISTNGLVFLHGQHADDLIASGLNHLRVSLDAATQETYSVYRAGGRLDPVLEGVGLLQKRKQELGRTRPVVELQFIAMRHNEHELPAVRRLAAELGTALRVKTVGLGHANREDRRAWLPEDVALRRYRDCDGTLELVRVGAAQRVCDHPWHRLVINWDGQVTPCCYDPHGDYALGNAADGIRNVWNGAAMRSFRQSILSSAPPAICTHCAMAGRHAV